MVEALLELNEFQLAIQLASNFEKDVAIPLAFYLQNLKNSIEVSDADHISSIDLEVRLEEVKIANDSNQF